MLFLYRRNFLRQLNLFRYGFGSLDWALLINFLQLIAQICSRAYDADETVFYGKINVGSLFNFLGKVPLRFNCKHLSTAIASATGLKLSYLERNTDGDGGLGVKST